jgi:hypothetical protein
MILFLVLAGALGWWVAQPGASSPGSSFGNAADASSKSSTSSTGSGSLLNRTTGSSATKGETGKWVPPEGDPVSRYREAKTKQERYDIISNFMALGHERNPFMLVEALKDPDVSNRVFAVESASALTAEESTHVLRQAAINDQWDVREMAWSLLAPYPPDLKTGVLAEVISNGADVSLEEAFSEMGRQPDIQLFDTMVTLSQKANPQRQTRLLKEMQLWLEPGGGDVPQFRSVQELLTWWQKTRPNYDEYMLRIDQ